VYHFFIESWTTEWFYYFREHWKWFFRPHCGRTCMLQKM